MNSGKVVGETFEEYGVVCHSAWAGALLGVTKKLIVFTALDEAFCPHDFQEEVVVPLKKMDYPELIDIWLTRVFFNQDSDGFAPSKGCEASAGDNVEEFTHV